MLVQVLALDRRFRFAGAAAVLVQVLVPGLSFCRCCYRAGAGAGFCRCCFPMMHDAVLQKSEAPPPANLGGPNPLIDESMKGF